MNAIFRGRRYAIVSETQNTVRLQGLDRQAAHEIRVAKDDVDLLIAPTPDDLNLAEAFERGEIGAFEYPDGHTYPPNREIPRPRRHQRLESLH